MCSHARISITMRIPDHILTPDDYPELARQGFITFRRRPRMTRHKLDRLLRRQHRILTAFGYTANRANQSSSPEQRCENCNSCIITGLTDGKQFKPFNHWCLTTSQPVRPDGHCPKGSFKWGPIIQVLRGQMTSIPQQ